MSSRGVPEGRERDWPGVLASGGHPGIDVGPLEEQTRADSSCRRAGSALAPAADGAFGSAEVSSEFGDREVVSHRGSSCLAAFRPTPLAFETSLTAPASLGAMGSQGRSGISYATPASTRCRPASCVRGLLQPARQGVQGIPLARRHRATAPGDATSCSVGARRLSGGSPLAADFHADRRAERSGDTHLGHCSAPSLRTGRTTSVPESPGPAMRQAPRAALPSLLPSDCLRERARWVGSPRRASTWLTRSGRRIRTPSFSGFA